MFLKVVVIASCLGIAVADVIGDIPPCSTDFENCNARDTSFNDVCFGAIRDHVQEELKASLQYLAMGAHFNQDHVNRQGVAEFFFKSASEEREHAMKFIEYLMMRGDSNVTMIGEDLSPRKASWTNVMEAFRDALDLEKLVTHKIQILTQACVGIDDFHASDFLTTKFLDEQLHGLREISGKIATLRTMVQRQPNLGEFLFDLELQSE